eukprot:m51a1_g7491 hypothetical protein (127) ;mRNA; r:251020-251505
MTLRVKTLLSDIEREIMAVKEQLAHDGLDPAALTQVHCEGIRLLAALRVVQKSPQPSDAPSSQRVPRFMRQQSLDPNALRSGRDRTYEFKRSGAITERSQSAQFAGVSQTEPFSLSVTAYRSQADP